MIEYHEGGVDAAWGARNSMTSTSNSQNQWLRLKAEGFKYEDLIKVMMKEHTSLNINSKVP